MNPPGPDHFMFERFLNPHFYLSGCYRFQGNFIIHYLKTKIIIPISYIISLSHEPSIRPMLSLKISPYLILF